MSSWTGVDPDPLPETVLIGFEWVGPPGQESEIRFQADVSFDPYRKQVADQIEADADRQGVEDGDESEGSVGAEAEPPGESGDPGGGGFPTAILVGIVAVGAAPAWF